MRMLLLVISLFFIYSPVAAGPVAAGPVAAGPGQCSAPLTDIDAPTELDLRLTCEAVGIARKALTQMGFNAQVPLIIRVKPRVEIALNETLMHQVFGQYDRTTNIIEVTDVAHHRGMAAVKPVFGLAFNYDVQRALVVHEVAHAVIEANFTDHKASRVAHEYIAYVAQLATMPDDMRVRAIEAQNTEAFDSDVSINEMILAIKPDLFAAKAYLHYVQPEQGGAFIDRLRSGDFDPDAGYWY